MQKRLPNLAQFLEDHPEKSVLKIHTYLICILVIIIIIIYMQLNTSMCMSTVVCDSCVISNVSIAHDYMMVN